MGVSFMSYNSNSDGFNVFLIVLLGFTIFGIYDCSKRKEEKEAYRQQQQIWKQTPEGQNQSARLESRSYNKIVISATGQIYYNGMKCNKNNCTEQIQGYQFAIDNGITNEDACNRLSTMLQYKGCILGVEDVIQSILINNNEKSTEGDW
jgi:hypothetical protein